MDFGKMAVFLYFAAINHVVADFLFHFMEKEKGGLLLAAHCFLYAISFIPLFWWLQVNLLWLILLFASHFIIDSQWWHLEALVKKILKKGDPNTPVTTITSGLDQTIHLLIIGIIAIFTFSGLIAGLVVCFITSLAVCFSVAWQRRSG